MKLWLITVSGCCTGTFVSRCFTVSIYLHSTDDHLPSEHPTHPAFTPCLLDSVQAWRRDDDDSTQLENLFISMWKLPSGFPSPPFFKSSAQVRLVYLWEDSHLNVTWTERCSLLWTSWYISGWIEGLGFMSSTLICFLTTWLQDLLHHLSKEIKTFHSWCTFSRGLMALLFPLQIMSGASEAKENKSAYF